MPPSKSKTLVHKLKDERQALLDRKQEMFNAIEAAKANYEKQLPWFEQKIQEYDSILALIEAEEELKKQREEEDVPF